jgi:hypothetical protein
MEYVSHYLLGSYALQSGREEPTFWGNLLPPSSGSYYSEAGVIGFFQNVSTFPPDYMVSCPEYSNLELLINNYYQFPINFNRLFVW